MLRVQWESRVAPSAIATLQDRSVAAPIAAISRIARLLYDLKHSSATIPSDPGEATEVIPKLIGHARPSTTGDFYTHPSDRAKREAMGRCGDLWA